MTTAGAFEVMGGGLTEEHPDDEVSAENGVVRLDGTVDGSEADAGVSAGAGGPARAGRVVVCSWSRTSPGTLRFSTSFSACRLQMVASMILILSFNSSTSLRTAFIKCDFTRSYEKNINQLQNYLTFNFHYS